MMIWMLMVIISITMIVIARQTAASTARSVIAHLGATQGGPQLCLPSQTGAPSFHPLQLLPLPPQLHPAAVTQPQLLKVPTMAMTEWLLMTGASLSPQLR